MENNSVSINLENNANFFSLKISNFTSEINILFEEKELFKLLNTINETKWSERKSIQAGKSANANVFWCKEEENICILIGHDDESWDIGLTFEYKLIHLIKKEFQKTKGSSPKKFL